MSAPELRNERRPGPAGKALVTGGAGFIGSHLVEALLEKGFEVSVLDDFSTGSPENLKAAAGPRLRVFEGKAEDEGPLREAARGARVVFHLAAVVGVRRVMDDPFGTIRTNVFGTDRVLEAAAAEGARVILASSSEVYGKGPAEASPFREDQDRVMGPTSAWRWSYAATKALDEFLALAYGRARGLKYVIIRLFNCTGPRQTGRYGMVVPRFVAQALLNRPLTVHGDGRQVRTFCWVKDAVRAVMELSEVETAEGLAVNVGGVEEVSIVELARRVREVAGSRSAVRLVPYEEAYGSSFEDMPYRKPDVSRLTSLLGWAPSTPLDEVIKALVDEARHWTKERLEGILE